MKKLIFIFIFLFFINATFAAVSEWYLYNGYSAEHSFSFKFPPAWKVKTFGDELQGFVPAKVEDELYFTIREFEGNTYAQAIKYFVDENTKLIGVEDEIFTFKQDYVGKRATYQNKKNGRKFALTFIKRGRLILAITTPNLENGFPVPAQYNDAVKGIFESLEFNDHWHQYIDFNNKYTFIFPTGFKINYFDEGVEISNPLKFGGKIFRVTRFADTPIDQVAKKAAGYGEQLLTTKPIHFHGYKNVISATYYDKTAKKKFSRIFIENNGDSFSLKNITIEKNYPHLTYYDTYLSQILESFEFFDIEGEYYIFKYFSDIRDNHPNAVAINNLYQNKIIMGYPDGTFKADNEINRAELTKMVVATKSEPDPYKYRNCFVDVKEEWFAPYICYAKENGWVEGYKNGRFNPEKKVNRMEALKIILETLGVKIPTEQVLKNTAVNDINIDSWYARYFIFAENNNLLDKEHVLSDKDTYKYFPDRGITRKEVAETIYRTRNLNRKN